MRDVQLDALSWNSACAAVARSSAVAPEFLVADNGAKRLLAARWRRHHVQTAEPQLLAEHVLSYCVYGVAACTLDVNGMHLQGQQGPRSLSILRAGRPVQWSLEAPHEVVHVHVYIPVQAVDAFAREHLGLQASPPLRDVIGVRDPWLDSFFRLLISEYDLYARRSCLSDSLFLDQTASLLIGHLLSAHSEAVAASRPGTRPNGHSRVSPLRPTIVRRVEEFIAANLSMPLRIDGLAAMATMSVDHFVRSFHAATGLTPHQYVLEHRLARACSLLRDESTSISGVAQQCGFSDCAHFSVTFHNHYGLTPSQYRRGH